MHTQRSGPAPAQTDASPVTQPSRTCENHQTSAYYTSTHNARHPRTYEAPLRTWTDVLAFVLFVALAVATVFIAGYMLIAALFILSQMVKG